MCFAFAQAKRKNKGNRLGVNYIQKCQKGMLMKKMNT